jgi:hypothetical protein
MINTRERLRFRTVAAETLATETASTICGSRCYVILCCPAGGTLPSKLSSTPQRLSSKIISRLHRLTIM